MITILHVTECAGGVERYLAMLQPRLKQQGYRQFLICGSAYDTEKFSHFNETVMQIDFCRSFSPIYVLKTVRIIRKEINQIKPDIVYCHSSFAGGMGRLAAVGLPCKVIYNPHGWSFNMR